MSLVANEDEDVFLQHRPVACHVCGKGFDPQQEYVAHDGNEGGEGGGQYLRLHPLCATTLALRLIGDAQESDVQRPSRVLQMTQRTINQELGHG